MISLKQGVKMEPLQPQIILGLLAVSSVYKEHGYDLVITSLSDGIHRPDSLHCRGCAVDLRTRHVAGRDIVRLVDAVRTALGSDFDVVLEADHLHIEYQPK